MAAAEKAGLETPFVQIMELGDFSITYRISGLLTDLGKLLSTRRELRATVLDELHNNDIEIVSPSFMNQRQLDKNAKIIPIKLQAPKEDEAKTTAPDDVVFDKAAKAESIEALRTRMEETSEKIKVLEAELKEADTDERKKELTDQITGLAEGGQRLQQVIDSKKERLDSEK